jgi:hypothetical protein
MKKTIRWTKSDIEEVLDPYFLLICRHNQGSYTPFTANFFTDLPFPCYGSPIEVKGPSANGSFYRDKSSPYFLEGSPNLGIFYNEEFCGCLCPEEQILVATDWGYGECIPIASLIIQTLAERKLLKPAPRKPLVFKITVGCDPEFELVNSRGVLSVSSSLTEDEDLGRSDNKEVCFIHSKAGQVGVDGSGDQIEIRPTPSEKAKDIVNNIKGLLEKFAEEFAEFRLAPSSERFPCGGHIHIGVQPEPSSRLYSAISDALDDFIGAPTKNLNGDRRASAGYGSLGDYRKQPHGMEYRTPSAAIFRNPRFAEVVLELAGNIAKKLVTGTEITYDVPISVEELVRIGGLSKKKAKLFLEECEAKPPEWSECLLAAWGVKVPPLEPPKPKIEIFFEDDWYSNIRTMLSKQMSGVIVDKNVRLTCFGLNRRRGNVFTFPVPGIEEIPPPHSGTTNYYGFSYDFRVGHLDTKTMEKIVAAFLQKVQQDLQGRIR